MAFLKCFIGKGKAVDSGDPILPVQRPRGYGGVVVLWRKEIAHLVQDLPDGGNRIKYIEIKGNMPILAVSVYMPCRGLKENVEDFAVYIISGTIPVEGTIHKRALILYGNVCRLDSSSVEQQVADRQLSIETMQSNSWLVAVRKITQKYELPDPLQLLRNPPYTHCALQLTGKLMAIMIIIISLFQEDNIFGTNASLTYGTRLQR